MVPRMCGNCPVLNPVQLPPLPPLPLHLSSTNNVPLPGEASDIRRMIHQGRVRLADLDSEIESLQDALDARLTARKAIEDQIHEASGILSPIRRLPTEILCDIFLRASSSEYRATDGPWNISRVCMRWREISIGSPRLWRDICGFRGAGRGFTIAALRTQLERSKPLDLYIQFNCGSLATDTYRADVLAILLDSSSRWRTVRMRLDSRLVPVLNEWKDGFPMLRHVNLESHGTDGVPPCTAFGMAPRLLSFTVDGLQSGVYLPWGQCRLLCLRIPESPEMLGWARQLVRLSLTEELFEEGVEPAYHDPIELPELQMLFLSDGRYLEWLKLPALQTICLLHCASRLAQFIDRSPCRLIKVNILDPAVDLIPILQRTPALVELQLQAIDRTAILLAHLTVNENKPKNCPDLRRLSLCDITEAEYHLAVQMVASRGEDAPVFVSVLMPAEKSEPKWWDPKETKHMEQLVGSWALKRLDSWCWKYPGYMG